jgi:hypothetical protein
MQHEMVLEQFHQPDKARRLTSTRRRIGYLVYVRQHFAEGLMISH